MRPKLKFEMNPSWAPSLDGSASIKAYTIGRKAIGVVRTDNVLGDESSKRVQSGEPLEIDVSILYFTGDPNSTLELAEGKGLPKCGSGLQTDPFRNGAQHWATDQGR